MATRAKAKRKREAVKGTVPLLLPRCAGTPQKSGQSPFCRQPWNLSPKQFDWLIAAGLVLLTAVVYAQAVNFEFTNYDDTAYVPDNTHVRNGFSLQGVGWAFTTFETANWYPLTWLSLMLDCQLFGPRPGVHHAVNVLLHAADVVLLYVALRRMTMARKGTVPFLPSREPQIGDPCTRQKLGQSPRWPSAAVAALFAVHPLHVESVAWIAERKDVLSTLFFLLALIAYHRYAAKPTLGRWSLVFLSMAVGLLCKPMLVTLPFVLLLLDYWPLGKQERAQGREGEREQGSTRRPLRLLIVEKLPLMALSAAAAVVTMIAQASQGATKMIGDKITLPLQLANAAVAYVKYLAMTFWPVDLAAFYPYDFHPRPSLIIGSAALLTVVTVAALWLRRRAPYVAVGWFWYLGTLVPTIGLVQVGAQSLADRYMYIPSIGVFVTLVWIVADLRTAFSDLIETRSVSEAIKHDPRLRFGLQSVSAAGTCAIVAVLMVAAHRQTAYWIDSEQLFRHALAVTGENPVACESLGDTLLRHDRYAEAEKEFRKVLAMDAKTFRQVPAELAEALDKQGRYQEAIALLRDALCDHPDEARSMNELAMILGPRMLDVAEAIELLKKTIELVPEQPAAARNLAWIYATCPDRRFRNGPKAVDLARRACELTDWSNAQYRVTLADAYLEIGDREHAIEEFRAALKLTPKDPTIAARLKTLAGY